MKIIVYKHTDSILVLLFGVHVNNIDGSEVVGGASLKHIGRYCDTCLRLALPD